MSEQSYSNKFGVSANAESAYKAITSEIDKWWTIESNEAVNIGDILTVGFGKPYFMSMEVEIIIPDQSLKWKVLDALMFIEGSGIKNDEWIGTKIQWNITKTSNGSEISLLHDGLVPSFECFATCKNGWDYFLGSLKNFLNTGKGYPYSDSVVDRP